MKRIGLTGLVKIELPDTTIRLTDGGYLRWDDEMFVSRHAIFGTVASVDALTEGVDAEVPALDMVLYPASTAAPADLSKPGYQRSRARMWLAEYDVDTGALDGDPDMLFDGQVDQTKVNTGAEARELVTTIVSTGERLFERNIGNSLSSGFHKSIWAGETGHDQATGLGRQGAWGVEAPPSTTRGYFQGGGSYAGGGGMTGRSSFGYIAL